MATSRPARLCAKFHTLCRPPEKEPQFVSVGCLLVPEEPVDPNQKYRLPQDQ